MQHGGGLLDLVLHVEVHARQVGHAHQGAAAAVARRQHGLLVRSEIGQVRSAHMPAASTICHAAIMP